MGKNSATHFFIKGFPSYPNENSWGAPLSAFLSDPQWLSKLFSAHSSGAAEAEERVVNIQIPFKTVF